MTGDECMDLEPYPGPPHYEPTVQESFVAIGKAVKSAFNPYVQAYEAWGEVFIKALGTKQSFLIPPRELNKPPRNHGPLPKRTYSRKGRKVY